MDGGWTDLPMFTTILPRHLPIPLSVPAPDVPGEEGDEGLAGLAFDSFTSRDFAGGGDQHGSIPLFFSLGKGLRGPA